MSAVRRYVMSQAVYEKAGMIAGRSSTRSKAPGRLFDIGRGPLYQVEARGATFRDADGNRFIDMLCALGAVALGHGRVTAMDDAPRIGSLPDVMEVRAAQAVLEHVAPWARSVRFVKTGSEATHAAYRIAKRATGRAQVWVGDWAYHGWHEWCSFNGDSLVSESGTALRYRHGENLRNFATFAGQLPAAVFIEPHRWVSVTSAWLRHVRDWCTEKGVLLVFDEMIYGGRLALGGVSEYFQITPDIACYGKAIGNGAPIACVVGCDAVAEHGEIVSGTYSGEPVACEAVLNTLHVYKAEPVIETLWKRGSRLQAGLVEALWETSSGDLACAEGAAVHQRLRFRDRAVACEFSAQMADRGVLWHPDCVNVSYAHSEAQIDEVVAAVRGSLAAVRAFAEARS